MPQPGRLVKVNGEVVDGARMLLSGDRIGIATRVLEFVYSESISFVSGGLAGTRWL